jgi:hypothetical protein
MNGSSDREEDEDLPWRIFEFSFVYLFFVFGRGWVGYVGVETLFCVRIIIKTCYLRFFIYKILLR